MGDRRRVEVEVEVEVKMQILRSPHFSAGLYIPIDVREQYRRLKKIRLKVTCIITSIPFVVRFWQPFVLSMCFATIHLASRSFVRPPRRWQAAPRAPLSVRGISSKEQGETAGATRAGEGRKSRNVMGTTSELRARLQSSKPARLRR